MKSCHIFKTIYGYAALASIEDKISDFIFPHDAYEEILKKIDLHKYDIISTNALLNEVSEKVCRYFLGDKVVFSEYKLDLSAYSAFQSKVIQIVQNQDYGKIITYKEVAILAGSENSARAVGQTMAKNKTPIIVPCHRVITFDKKLGGFSAGLDWKLKLLNLEGIML